MTNLPALNKTAVTAAPILPILAERWSPRSFDENYVLTEHEVLSILEAARWAPSANNAQPWRFSVLHRGSDLFNTVVEQGLTGWNQAWAPKASALIILSVKFENADGAENQWVNYDAGLAAANLTAQATELGLSVHTMAGIIPAALHEVLGLAEDTKALVALAVGKLAPADKLEGVLLEREVATRTRLSLDEIVLHGKP